MEESKEKSYGYGKRPLWQWVLLYLIIGAVVYGLIYYFIFSKKGYSVPSSMSPQITNTQSNNAPTSNIYQMKSDPVKGSYLTDFQGMTLYVSDKDTSGVSNCVGSCAQAWPPYTSGAVMQGTFPTNISVLTRQDGSKQFAWKGMPLYYFTSDTKPGQITGDGLNGFHVAK